MLSLSIILFGLVLFIIGLFALYGLYIYLRRYEYTRERFAFAALFTVSSMGVAVLASIGLDLTPWHLAAAILDSFTGRTTKLPEATWSEQAFLVAVYFIAVKATLQLHRQWKGLKSTEQYQREQRSEPSGLVLEGLHEARRLVNGHFVHEPHSDSQHRHLLTQLEPMTDSLAWKDQARELLRLSSSSYAFDLETGWHDREGYWLGTNVGRKEPVLLFPFKGSPRAEELENLIAQTEITSQASKQLEVIVALKDGAKPELAFTDPRIRIETEESFLNNLVDFTDYFNEIRKRATVSTLPDSELTLESVYTPSQAENSKETVEDLIGSWLSESGQRQLALLGGYGQGKSTTALMLAYRLISTSSANGARLQRVPLLIELRGTSPRNLTPLQLLGAWAAQYNLNPLALMRLHIAGRLLLIFEGFDEMALVGDSEMRLKHFRVLWQFCYPKAKIIITGRPNFFLDQEEMKAALGISKPMIDRPYCEAIRLAPFTLKQIEDALRLHPATVREPICKLVRLNSRFAELVSRPSLLHIVAILWDKERLSERVDRLSSAYVMDLFVRHSYRRQGLKQSDSPEFMALTSSEREYLMQAVAAFMVAKSLPNQISGPQLNEVIERAIEEMPDTVSTEPLTIADESSTPLRLRLTTSDHGVEHVKTDTRACGLLVDDPASPGMFRFGHKSFMEYLFASVVSQLFRKESAKAQSIMRISDARIDHILSSHVSLDFLAEILGEDGRRTLPLTEDENTAVQMTISEQTIATILGGSRSFLLVQKFLLIDLVSRLAILRSESVFRFFAPFASILILPLFIMLVAVIVQLFLVLGEAEREPARLGNLSNLFALLILMIIPLSLPPTSLRRRLRIWVRLCTALNIEDRVLHRTIGSWLVPWAKNKSFVSLLKIDDSSPKD